DHSPPRADPAGEDGDDDLEDADGGVAEQEAVHAEAAEEDAQQPHHEAALRLALGCAALGRGALREASLAGRAGAAGLAIGVGGRGAGARCCGPALLPLGVGIGGGPGRRLRERILPGGGLLSVGVRGGAGRGLREGVLAVGARRAVRALLAIRALRAGRVLRAVGILLAVGLCAGGRLAVRALRRAGLLGGRLRPRILRGLRRGALCVVVALGLPGAVVTGSAHGPHTTWSQHGAARRRSSGAARAMSHASAAALLADPHPDHDRRAREGEVLPQATLDEAAVAVLEEAAGEDDEPRRPRARLRREEDPGLLAAAQRMRMRRDQLAQEG